MTDRPYWHVEYDNGEGPQTREIHAETMVGLSLGAVAFLNGNEFVALVSAHAIIFIERRVATLQ